MRLAWIEVRDFRNHHETSLPVPGTLTAVVGPNGHGKTNLLEAMYYLGCLESPRVRGDMPLVRSGALSAFLRGEFHTESGRHLVEVEVRASGQNRVLVNRSPVRRKRDLRRLVRCVFAGPDDLAIVGGDPDERRRFMDESLRSVWPAKEETVINYERVLRQRNRLLKEWGGHGEPPGLAAWDGQLVGYGCGVTRARAQLIRSLERRASDEFSAISGEPLVVEYRPSVWGEELEGGFEDRLAERRPDELARRTTLVGPHRDDLFVSVGGLAARNFASHGETWAAALSLRLALAAAVEKEAGEAPLLFLDDPFSALDPERRRRVAANLDSRGQVVLAVPDEAQIPSGAHVWRVKEGTVVAD